jgi:xylose isomerase
MGKIKYSAITGSLGQVSDRFMPCGYRDSTDDTSFSAVVKRLAALKLLDAVELCYASEGLESDPLQVKQIIKTNGFYPTYVNSSFFNERIWKAGSLAASDKNVRKAAMDTCYKLIDFADETGAKGINLWLGQDGYDYSFQVDYKKQWKWLVDSLKELADYKPGIKILVEPKPREPRNRSLVDTTSTALLMSIETGRDNVGLTVDIGHVLYAGGNMAHDVEIANKYGKLFNLHANDNYATWDDDMIVGSVHMVEYLELFYVLKKIDYDQSFSVDIFPYREDPIEATRECLLNMKLYEKLVDKIGMDKIEEVIATGNACEATKMIREGLF